MCVMPGVLWFASYCDDVLIWFSLVVMVIRNMLLCVVVMSEHCAVMDHCITASSSYPPILLAVVMGCAAVGGDDTGSAAIR